MTMGRASIRPCALAESSSEASRAPGQSVFVLPVHRIAVVDDLGRSDSVMYEVR
jgi:hypothetical protein